VEVNSAITNQHSALFCLLWWMQITIFYLWMQVAKEEFLMEASSGAVNWMCN
jgi:hypothetical protein